MEEYTTKNPIVSLHRKGFFVVYSAIGLAEKENTMIECKKYNLNELRETLGFGRRAWETRQEELLEYLGQFFKFEKYTKGRAIIFDIQEQYEEYIPFPSKRDAEKIRQYYSEKTEEVVREKPWNTGSCIARNIILKSENNIYNHKEDTAARYVRGILREEKYFTSQSDSQWMRLSADKLSYVPLTDEETAYLTGLFYSYTEEGR